jgi:hypothetical protein
VADDVGAGIAGEGPTTSDTLHVPEDCDFVASGVGADRYLVTVGTGCGEESPSYAGESDWGFSV